MQTYTFIKEELIQTFQRLCTLFACQDGVYDFSPDHAARDIAIADLLTELDEAKSVLEETELPPIEESWIDQMIREEERESFADDTQAEREMSLAEMLELRQELDPDAPQDIAIPFTGNPIIQREWSDDYGLQPPM